MHTIVYTNAAGFDALAGEWDDLLARSVNPPFFMRYCYQRNWWRYLGNDDLALIAVRDGAGRLVGLAPLYGTRNPAGQRELTFVGCVDVSDYLDLLVDKDYVDEVYAALLDCLADRSWQHWTRLYLCSLPHQSLTHTRLAGLARARGWQTRITQQDVCPVITLPDSWDTYLAGLDKKQRHEVRRKMRRLENEAQARWYVVDNEEELEGAMDSFISLHQRSTQDKEGFWSEALVLFFKALAVELARANWLRLYFMDINGQKAAAMLCFDYNNEFLLYNSGYDPQFFPLSPGNVLTAYTIQDAIRLGRTRYDFLRGDEIYKFRFGAQPEPVYDLEIF